MAQADNGGFADNGSNTSVTTVVGSGVGGGNFGDSTTTQQVATGSGASGQNNTANVNGGGFTSIGRSKAVVNPLVVPADSRGPARGGWPGESDGPRVGTPVPACGPFRSSVESGDGPRPGAPATLTRLMHLTDSQEP